MDREIVRFCKVIIRIINERDFDFQSAAARQLRTLHISPDWYGTLNDCTWTITLDQQIEFWRQLTDDYPKMQFELVGVDCEILQNARTADVVMRTAMVEGDIRFLTACNLKWKFSDNRWQWYYHSGMRGVCEV